MTNIYRGDIACAIDLRHSALPRKADKFVTPELSADHRAQSTRPSVWFQLRELYTSAFIRSKECEVSEVLTTGYRGDTFHFRPEEIRDKTWE